MRRRHDHGPAPRADRPARADGTGQPTRVGDRLPATDQPTRVGDRLPATDREIVALAVPALGALVAEPLFLLADSAVVGRLGTAPLAALGIAGALLAGAVSLLVFLAYGATADVARHLGAGDPRGALARGLDGMWLALFLGAALLLAGAVWAAPVVDAFDAPPDVAADAVRYLRWSLPGLPGMLVVLAGTGVLRGLQDTRTPLAIAAWGAAANIALNLLLVHGIGRWHGLGIAGSAIGTALAQTGMGVAVTGAVVAHARRLAVPLRPRAGGIRRSGRTGIPLLVRTLALRAALLVTTWVAAKQGTVPMAAHQIAFNLWILAALALDALAIAGQALTGRALGAGDLAAVRALTDRMVRWGLAAGGAIGTLLLAVRPVLGPLFTDDPAVHSALAAVLLVAALAQPLAGYVFVLDGLLIGAGDGRFLAVASLVQTAAFAPAALMLDALVPVGVTGLVWLWLAFAGGYMLSRAILLGVRAHGDRWMIPGAPG